MRLPQDRILHISTELKDGKVNVLAEWQGELVRCKDCKWYKKIVEKSKSGLCHYDLVARCLHDEDYCSHGERREE